MHIDAEMLPWLDGQEEKSDNGEGDEPDMLDVLKPYLRVELLTRAVHFLVPKWATIAEKNG